MVPIISSISDTEPHVSQIDVDVSEGGEVGVCPTVKSFSIPVQVGTVSQMKSNPLENQPAKPEIGIYDCEVHLKFKLIEDKSVLSDRDRLLEMLLDAFSCGADEYLEPIQVNVVAQEISETEASARMRRQVIRLRNSSKLS